MRATDTCRRIALTYGTTQAQITSWNPNVGHVGGGVVVCCVFRQPANLLVRLRRHRGHGRQLHLCGSAAVGGRRDIGWRQRTEDVWVLGEKEVLVRSIRDKDKKEVLHEASARPPRPRSPNSVPTVASQALFLSNVIRRLFLSCPSQLVEVERVSIRGGQAPWSRGRGAQPIC